MMMEGAHFHNRGPLEPLADVECEFGFIVPGILRPCHRVASVECIEIDHVEAGIVIECCGLRCDFGE